MAELQLIPVHTRILTKKDHIVDAIREYAGKDITDRDIICSAESVVAITQGRYTRPEELNVCWQARVMNRFVPPAAPWPVCTECRRLCWKKAAGI